MDDHTSVVDPELERKGRRLARPGGWFVLLAALVALSGVVLIVVASGWAQSIGIALVALAGPPLAVGVALMLSSLVARWAARHRSFA